MHGLAGDWNTTWFDEATSTFFPDLLSSDQYIVHKLRIHSFHYDNDIFKTSPLSQLPLFGKEITDAIRLPERAKNFLEHIASDDLYLNNKKYKKVPMIFIGHSMGGLVVKQALLQAYASKDTVQKRHYYVYKKALGILFYATPHIGATIASVATYPSRFIPGWSYVANIFGFGMGEGVNDLQLLSAELRELNDKFVNLIHQKKMNVHCLYETKTQYMGINAKVAEYSSCTGFASIFSTHRHICCIKIRSEFTAMEQKIGMIKLWIFF